MDTGEWFKRTPPFNLVSKGFQRLRLALSQNRKWLDYSIIQSFEEFRRACLGRLENVARELAIVRTLLGNDKIVDFSELLPDLSELCQDQFPEERADADVSEIITFAANRAAARGIVSVFWMIKCLFHEPGEGLWSPIADLGSNDLDQRGVSRLCHQRPTRLRRKLRRGKRPTLEADLDSGFVIGH